MLELTTIQWLVAALCAFLIGFSKMGISGAGFLVVPLLAGVMDSKESTGFLLPILNLADILAILWWHQHVDWKQLIRLLVPWTLAGVVAGYFLLDRISSRELMPVIGMLIIALMAVTSWLNRMDQSRVHLPSSRVFAGIMGLLAGLTSMLANAAGPIMTIYLLAMRFEKKQFIGTTAMFFFILNLSKIPFSFKLNLVTGPSLLTNLALFPAILLGGVAGVLLVHKIDQKKFDFLMMALALGAAIFICLKPLFTH